MLVGREKELNTLEGFYQGALRLKVMLVEGRSGSGKTALCREFIAGKPTIGIWNPSPTDERVNLRKAAFAVESFLKNSDEHFPLIEVPESGFKSWGRFFSCLCALTTRSNQRISFVIDDYPAVCAASPSFYEAFDAAVDVLSATRLFMLITAANVDLDSCKLPMAIDPKLATSSNAIRLRMAGSAVLALAEPQSNADCLAVYARKGCIPGRYAENGLFSARAILNTLSKGHDASKDDEVLPDRLFHALACCSRPILGIDVLEASEACDTGKLETNRLFKVLRGLDLASTDQCCWYEQPNEHQREQSPAAFSEVRSKRMRLLDLGDIVAERPDVSDWSREAFLELAREWMWSALREGDFPNEFEEVCFWLDGSASGDCIGLIGINGHLKRVVGCSVLEMGEALTCKRLDEALALTATLPYKAPHCAVVSAEPIDQEVLKYAQSVRNLTLAILGPTGIRVVSCPWQTYSRRYQEAQAYLAAKSSEG